MIPITHPSRGILRTTDRVHARSVARTLFDKIWKVPSQESSSRRFPTTPLGVASSTPKKVSCLSWIVRQRRGGSCSRVREGGMHEENHAVDSVDDASAASSRRGGLGPRRGDQDLQNQLPRHRAR